MPAAGSGNVGMGVFAGAGATPLGRPVNTQFRFPTARSLWAAYCTSLVARPLLTKSSTSLAGFCLGDFIAQQATRRSHRIKDLALEPYDVQRTLRLAFYGGCVAGPIGHYWFSFLDKARSPEALMSLTSTWCFRCTEQIPCWCCRWSSAKQLPGKQNYQSPFKHDCQSQLRKLKFLYHSKPPS